MSNESPKQSGQSKRMETAIPIDDQQQREYLEGQNSSSKRLRFYQPDYITTNDYDDSLVLDIRLCSKALITAKNTHATNPLVFQVMGCIDPKDWQNIPDSIGNLEVTLAAGYSVNIPISDAWAFLKLRAKSATVGNSASLLAYAIAKT